MNCWAKRMAYRLRGRCGYPKDDPFKVTFHPDRLDEPLRWRKPCRIFPCSMGDLFHPAVQNEWREKIYHAIYLAKWHTFIVLTKRQMAMRDWHQKYNLSEYPLTNLWPGVSIENQRRANERLPALWQMNAAMKVVSIEPMLGPVVMAEACDDWWESNGIGFVIVGCESGPKRRPCKLEWIADVVRQCREAGVPCFVKAVPGEDGRILHDVNLFPKELQVREFPT